MDIAANMANDTEHTKMIINGILPIGHYIRSKLLLKTQ